MRPGSAERIAYYQARAEEGSPLFDDVPAGIPMRPGEDNALGRLKMVDVGDSFDRAIELLAGDDAAEKMSRRIDKLEHELTKLKKLQKALHGGTATSSQKPMKLDADMESKIVEFLKSSGPKRPSEIGDNLGVSYTMVGKIVRSSQRLAKDGPVVVLSK